MSKKVKARSTPAEEREFIVAALEKEIQDLNDVAKACASMRGAFDYEQAGRLSIQAEAIADAIITVENLDEDWS